MRGQCNVVGCTRQRHGHGYCRSHYWRLERWGDPLGTAPTTTERDQRVIELTLANWPTSRIAQELRITDRTVTRIRSRKGIPQGHCGIPPTPEELTQAEAMLIDGASYNDVGRTLSRSPATISRHLPGYGWTPTITAQYRHMMAALNAIPARTL